MSRWISSVNKLLDNLDTNVGDVVENQVEMFDGMGTGTGTGMEGVGGESSVDDILAKRGLLNNDEDEEEDADEEEDVEDLDEEDDLDEEEAEDEEEVEEEDVEDDDEEKCSIEDEGKNEENGDTINETISNENENNNEDENINQDQGEEDENQEEELIFDNGIGTDANKNGDGNGTGNDQNDNIDGANNANSGNNEDNESEQNLEKDKKQQNGDEESSLPTESLPDGAKVKPNTNTNIITNNNTNTNSKPIKTKSGNTKSLESDKKIIAELKKQLKEQKSLYNKTKKETAATNAATNKETRKLRRTVVKINTELDSAERELDAQRTELERAAVRMDKERQRYKDDKERLEKSHKEDMKAVMEEHKISIDAMVTSHAEQMVDMEERIKRAEEARAREGGDMSMELADSAERERETLKKVMNLEEEKATFTSQIASLNTQMSALQSRVESLQEAAEVASEQEREADDRLDAALSLHTRQIGLRQAREAELERTIADIAAALVVARQREAQEAKGVSKNVEESDEDLVGLKQKLVTAEEEADVFKAQIMLERQKSETLQNELEDISTERTQELSSSLARQKQHDRQVSDLSVQVTRLQSKLRSFQHPDSLNESDDSEEDVAMAHFRAKENEHKKQISALSEDLLRQRGRLENTTTEVRTLRNRLRAALNRAEIAEKEAKDVSVTPLVDHSYDIERGPMSKNYGGRTRRRFGGRSKKTATIRSVLKLDAGSGETREAIGASIDSLDLATTKMLNIFRTDPFARIFFIVYLVILHLWAFCLLAFHAHGTLEPSANVGPEQLLKHSYRHMEQVHDKP